MIITCPCEKKQFKIDSSLIPQEGRELQCGSCERVWFYKPKNESEAPLTLNENISENKILEIRKREEFDDLLNKQIDIFKDQHFLIHKWINLLLNTYNV